MFRQVFGPMAASSWGSGAPDGPMFRGNIEDLLDRPEKASERLLGPLAPHTASADGAVDGVRGGSEQVIKGSWLEDLATAANAFESLCQADGWAERSDVADWRLRSVMLQLLAAPALRSQAAPTPPPAPQAADVAEHDSACRVQLLRLCSVAMQADAEMLRRARVEPASIVRSSAGGGGTSSNRSGRQRTGAAASGVAAAACVRPHESLQLQALRFGCAVLRLDTLQCCSAQLAAVRGMCTGAERARS